MKSGNCEGCELKNLFFENVSNKVIECMCSHKIEQSYKKEEIIIREGDEIKDFSYLKSGLVKLYRKGQNGREQIICFALPLDFVRLLCIFSENRYNYSVTALHDTVISSMNLIQIKSLVIHKFATNIMQKTNRATDRIIKIYGKERLERISELN